MEKIISINEVKDKEIDDHFYDGYEIQTDKQTIYFLICNEQDCCEIWGYLTSQDDPIDFIGSEIIDIILTDSALKSTVVQLLFYRYGADDSRHLTDNEEGIEFIFANINTTKGTLQLTAYNNQNGYYGHKVKIMSKQINHEEMI